MKRTQIYLEQNMHNRLLAISKKHKGESMAAFWVHYKLLTL